MTFDEVKAFGIANGLEGTKLHNFAIGCFPDDRFVGEEWMLKKLDFWKHGKKRWARDTDGLRLLDTLGDGHDETTVP